MSERLGKFVNSWGGLLTLLLLIGCTVFSAVAAWAELRFVTREEHRTVPYELASHDRRMAKLEDRDVTLQQLREEMAVLRTQMAEQQRLLERLLTKLNAN